MKLPRDLSGRALARGLETFGYTVTRQTGSHLRLTTQQHGEHHVTIPDHHTLKVGTLAAVLGEVAARGPRRRRSPTPSVASPRRRPLSPEPVILSGKRRAG